MEREDKNCVSLIGALGTIKKGLIRSEPSVAPRSPVGDRATGGHTNEHCTQHLCSAEGSGSNLLLRSGLTRRTPSGN